MKRRNIIMTLFSVIVALLFVRCADDGEVGDFAAELDLSTTSLEVSKVGGELPLKVDANTKWTAEFEEECDWLHLSSMSGDKAGEIMVTIDENFTVESREATVEITCDVLSADFVVTQAAGDDSVILTPASIAVTREATGESVVIEANTTWEAEAIFDDGVAAWFSIDPSDGADGVDMAVTIDENVMATNRSAVIMFTTPNGDPIEYTVLQSGADAHFAVSSEQIVAGTPLDESLQTITLNVVSNVNWTIEDLPVDSWLTPSKMEGVGNATITVEVAANEPTKARDYTLKFNYADTSSDIKVEQDGNSEAWIYFGQGDASIAQALSSSGEAKPIVDITSNDTWTVSIPQGDQSWLSSADVDCVSGTFMLTAIKNDGSDQPRSSTVTLVCDADSNKSATIEVTQNSALAELFSINVTEMDFDKDGVVESGSSESIIVSSNTTWSVVADYGSNPLSTDWISGLTTGDQTAGTTLTIAVRANETGYEREATIKFTAAGITGTKDITVTQAAGDATLSALSVSDIPAAGETISVEVVSNIAWKLQEWIKWANVTGQVDDATWNSTSTTGTGTQTVSIDVAENKERSSRGGYEGDTKAQLFLTDTDDNITKSANFAITQLGAEPFVTPTATATSLLPSSGSTQLSVESNVNWSATIASSDSNNWLTVDNQTTFSSATTTYNTTSYTLTAAENLTASSRTATITFVSDDAADQLASSVTYVISQSAYSQDAPEFTISQVDANNLIVEVTNSKFMANTTFDASNFKMTYTNTYEGANLSGGIAIASVTGVDTSDLFTKLEVVLTDPIYNTDDLKFWCTNAASIEMFTGAAFVLAEPTAANVTTTFIEYVNNDFESGADGWSVVNAADGTALSNVNYAAADPQDSSNKVLYINGDGSYTFSILSSSFKTEVKSMPIYLKAKFYLPSAVTSDGITATLNSVASGAYKGKISKWIVADSSITNAEWLAFNNKAAETWHEVKIGYKADENFDTFFEDMRLTMNSNYYNSEIYMDDIRLNNGETR